MKKNVALIFSFACALMLFACKSKDAGPKNNLPKTYDFTISGNIKNIRNQKIFLRELSFSSDLPKVLDSTNIQNGAFKMSAKAAEEGLYQLLTEDGKTLIFVNDENNIVLNTDDPSFSLQQTVINSPSNKLLFSIVRELDKKSSELNNMIQAMGAQETAGNDSITQANKLKVDQKVEEYNNYLITQFKATTDPIVATVALGNTSFPDPAAIKSYVEDLPKRFPTHKGIAAMVKDYMQANSQDEQSMSGGSGANIIIGKPAPEFTLKDVDGNAVSLSSFKGKYVLVDFWASWCAPCRGENPNVLEAFNQLKNKNFTVLGVSLDNDKSAWLKAIKEDGLTWTHVSDLKGWQSDVVGLYGINGIPFNVLVSPEGIVLAKELRGEGLYQKVTAMMK